jgi:ABC-type Fe3+-hydroxamate transport system substrate-binding protein
MSDMATLEEALAMIQGLGELTATGDAAAGIIQDIRGAFAALNPAGLIPAAYFIWKEPYMTVGHDTFIQDMLGQAGFANVFQGRSRYPEVQPEEIRQARPQVILLSSEPYPFRDKHRDEFQALCPGAQVILVDGEMFSWYGSRLRLAPAYFKQLRQQVAAGRELLPGPG